MTLTEVSRFDSFHVIQHRFHIPLTWHSGKASIAEFLTFESLTLQIRHDPSICHSINLVSVRIYLLNSIDYSCRRCCSLPIGTYQILEITWCVVSLAESTQVCCFPILSYSIHS